MRIEVNTETIERAAKYIWDSQKAPYYKDWEQISTERQDQYRDMAERILRAAAGRV